MEDDAISVSNDPIAVIQAAIDDWESPIVELDIFGTARADKILAVMDEFCCRHLGSGIAGYLFQKSSIGSAHGVRLRDGRKVVVKAHLPASANRDLNTDASSLSAVRRVMGWLNGRGYPCAPPIAGPAPLGAGLATVEGFLEGGRRVNGLDPKYREAMAIGLADLVETLRSIDFDTSCLKPFFGGRTLYPQPHSKLFDFEKTEAGAEWIDALAARARTLERHDGPPVLGHGDWRVEHVLFDRGEIVATYDWDSLAWMPEAKLVASAAYSFSADWTDADRPNLPRAADIQAFIADYEQARGRPFSNDERRSLLASCVYGLAYGARCSHALRPEIAHWPEDSFPFVLREDGESLLRVIEMSD